MALQLRTGFDSDYGIRRSYIKFDIPNSIAEDCVVSAVLNIEKVSGATPNISAFRNTGSWSSSSITWNNKPSYSTSNKSSNALPISSGSAWYTMDVTDIVQQWTDQEALNYGFLIMDSNEADEDHWTTFYSSDMDSPHKPELHITYLGSSEVDRAYSTYSQTEAYRNVMASKMNCYGYALHVYSLASEESLWTSYKQQPGEFAIDNQTCSDLIAETQALLHSPSTTGTEALDYFEEKIRADFAALAAHNSSEWMIVNSTASATVPSGRRKIALTINLSNDDADFHFYMRHSDGMWSHKQGADYATCYSIDTNVVITDSNITSVINEGGYDDGCRYYLITKPAIVDYPHEYGHGVALSTETSFKDCAGDIITKGTTITGTSKAARFDYRYDIDCYIFTPTSSGIYTFTTSLVASTYDVNMEIYDSNSSLVSTNYGVGNPTISVTLSANAQYFIRVWDENRNVVNYTLYYNS